MLFLFFLVGLVYSKLSTAHLDLSTKIVLSKAYPSITNFTTAMDFVRVAAKHGSMLQLDAAPALREPTTQAFPCPILPRSDPTNVRRLRPADIDVIATIGDSVAAGFGALARNIFGIFTEYRGHAFSVGGKTDYNDFLTVANIIRLYNPNVKGFAIGEGGPDSANAKLNVAVSGARSYDLPAQVDALEARMKSLGVDMAHDWKLLSIFIGGNDLCDYCDDTNKHSPANFAATLEGVLDSIKARFPRVFVNLMTPPDVTLLGEVSSGLCSILHAFECACNDDPGTKVAHRHYTDHLIALANLPKYQDKIDFHVSVQPFLANLTMPRKPDGSPDDTYFAPDCFHFSGKAHQAAGVALWNNMCELTNKRTSWIPGEPIECPKEFIA